MGPLELLQIAGVIWLALTVLVIRRVGWVLGIILALTLVPVAAIMLTYGALFVRATLMR